MVREEDSSVKVTLKDIAKRVNRSVATVSLALSGNERVNEQTRQLVQNACQTLGYFSKDEIADRIVSKEFQKRKMRFSLVIFGPNPWNDLGPFLEVLLREAESQSIHVSIRQIPDTTPAPEVLEILRQMRDDVDGFILTHLIHREVVEALGGCDFPVIVCGLVIEGNRLCHCPEYPPVVTFDALQIGRCATLELVRHGFRRIAFFSAKGYDGLYYHRIYEGYRLCLIQENLEYDGAFFLQAESYTRASEKLTDLLSSGNCPDAYLVTSSYYAGRLVKDFGVELDRIILVCDINPEEKEILDGCRAVQADWQQLAKATFNRLDLLVRKKIERGFVLFVPFSLPDA